MNTVKGTREDMDTGMEKGLHPGKGRPSPSSHDVWPGPSFGKCFTRYVNRQEPCPHCETDVDYRFKVSVHPPETAWCGNCSKFFTARRSTAREERSSRRGRRAKEPGVSPNSGDEVVSTGGGGAVEGEVKGYDYHCPDCGEWGDVDLKVVPPSRVKVRCPGCGLEFSAHPGGKRDGSRPTIELGDARSVVSERRRHRLRHGFHVTFGNLVGGHGGKGAHGDGKKGQEDGIPVNSGRSTDRGGVRSGRPIDGLVLDPLLGGQMARQYRALSVAAGLLVLAALLGGLFALELWEDAGTGSDVPGLYLGTVTVHGRVVDSASGHGVPGVHITLDPEDPMGNTDTITTAQGRFSFENVTAGTHIIEARSLDHRTSRLEVTYLSREPRTVIMDIEPGTPAEVLTLDPQGIAVDDEAFFSAKRSSAVVVLLSSVMAFMAAFLVGIRRNRSSALLMSVLGLLSVGYLYGMVASGIAALLIVSNRGGFQVDPGNQRYPRDDRH